MEQGMSVTEMRVALLILGVVVLALIYWFGTRGKRGSVKRPAARSGARVEPTLDGTVHRHSDSIDVDRDGSEPQQTEFRMGATEIWPQDQALPLRGTEDQETGSSWPRPGTRPPQQPLEHIVTLYVVPRQSAMRFRGSELVVAAEKAGLEFGDLGIFHRMLDGKRELGPIFSAANMVKPGHFDMGNLQALESPGLSVFMTLPGPLPALDAWDTMLPVTQRIAELLDGQVVDEDRNALGRQGIAYIRDDLRAWDRRHEGDDVQLDRG